LLLINTLSAYQPHVSDSVVLAGDTLICFLALVFTHLVANHMATRVAWAHGLCHFRPSADLLQACPVVAVEKFRETVDIRGTPS
jgi:hypothetical protein